MESMEVRGGPLGAGSLVLIAAYYPCPLLISYQLARFCFWLLAARAAQATGRAPSPRFRA
jgi:hypothetical protein